MSDNKNDLARPYEVFVLTPWNAGLCLDAADLGDWSARNSLLAMKEFLARIKEPKERHLCVCLDCNTQFSLREPPLGFAIVMPMFPAAAEEKDLQQAVACAICKNCINRPDLLDQLMIALRKIWPSIEVREYTMQ